MSSGGNVHILCGSRDISLTCTDCSDETGGIDRDDLFIGGGPLDGELRGSFCNLFLLGFIVSAIAAAAMTIDMIFFFIFNFLLPGVWCRGNIIVIGSADSMQL